MSIYPHARFCAKGQNGQAQAGDKNRCEGIKKAPKDKPLTQKNRPLTQQRAVISRYRQGSASAFAYATAA